MPLYTIGKNRVFPPELSFYLEKKMTKNEKVDRLVH